MGVLDMALYRVKKLVAWAIALGILALVLIGLYWVIEVGAGG